jgi:cellulose synthase/poly-beta-1,6-N-acetylglucosamine synthase-like glycosyltransferase
MVLNIFLGITALLLIPYSIILLLYRKWFLQLRLFEMPQQFEPSTSFSIIIPARNEEANISKCVDSIMAQSYPKYLFEIIVIDDHSTDGTSAIVKALQAKHNNIQLISLADELDGKLLNAYKKKAIEKAIGYANYEWIVTTDADCIVKDSWLKSFAAFIEEKRLAFVAAPVIYTKDESLLSIFQFIDFMSLQGITAASVSVGFHNMCNGANLAYRKDVFYEVNGFKGIDNIASGDDMLLMNKIKQQHPNGVGFLFSKEAIVATHPMPDWKSFFNQRIRWASKAEQLKEKDKRVFFVLVLVYLFNVLLFIMPLLSFFNPWMFIYWFGFLSIKTLVEILFAIPVGRFFGQPFTWWFPLLQPVHIAYMVISGWLGKFGSYKWKGRSVR